MKHMALFLFISVLNVILCHDTFAHKASDSYLRLTVENTTIQGQWDISLRDLEHAIGLDENDDGRITWGELQGQYQAITNHAFSRLHMNGSGSRCWNNTTELLVDHHSDGAYAVLRFSAICPQPPDEMAITYNLFFDLDPLHRGLVQFNGGHGTQTGVFSPGQRTIQFDSTKGSFWKEFLQFGKEGVWHIWIGYDHILFLISLLLPAVLFWAKWTLAPTTVLSTGIFRSSQDYLCLYSGSFHHPDTCGFGDCPYPLTFGRIRYCIISALGSNS